MTTAAAEQLMTAKDLERLPDDGSVMYELDEGRLVCLSPSSSVSAIVALNIGGEMRSFVKQHKLGVCGGADWGFKLASKPDTVRAPDVSFIRADRIPKSGIPRRGYWQGPPDLAVEVLSPTNRPGEMWKRIGDLLAAGTRLVWVVDLERRTATVIHPDGDLRTIDETGALDGEDILPSFTLPLRDVLV